MRDLYGEVMQNYHRDRSGAAFCLYAHLPVSSDDREARSLLMNHILISTDYFPCVMHVKDRQRYYQALRDSLDDVRLLAVESMENTLRHSAESIS